MTNEQALTKRRELVESGYTIVPGVMDTDLLHRLRTWSDRIFERVTVPHKIRYQGSDIFVNTERRWREGTPTAENRFPDPIAAEIIDQPAQLEACRQIGLENLVADDTVIILSKPGYGPPLYWHQDFMKWQSPEAATPWPIRIFLSYYLTDTTRENGCLRMIPGSHRKRHKLHDILPKAHGSEIQAIDDLSHPAFADYPDAIDIPLNAGDLVIADARILHGAWPNQTAKRRTLLLAWHDVFSFPNPPSWWDGDVPEAVRDAEPSSEYEKSHEFRTPSHYLT
ncbi:MAG: phytanoyl-CoA dioxygenase family protein [Gemmatimonadetes bacterium]|nr:phytanoyl-CoA dioxygenase family protein [Gemmatimonadota bacterium]